MNFLSIVRRDFPKGGELIALLNSPSGRLAILPSASPYPCAAAFPAAWRAMSAGSASAPDSWVTLTPPDVWRKGGDDRERAACRPPGGGAAGRAGGAAGS